MIAGFFAFANLLEAAAAQYAPESYITGVLHCVYTSPRVAIWALDTSCIDGDEYVAVFESKCDLAVRQFAQSGLYTKARHPRIYCLAEYLAYTNRSAALRQYVLPGSEIGAVMTDLAGRDISFRTLFPDIEGFAKDANVAEVLGVLRSIPQLNRTSR